MASSLLLFAPTVLAALCALRPPTKVEVVALPSGAVQFHAAVDASGTLHVVFTRAVEDSVPVPRRNGTLFYCQRASGSKAWSTPIQVNRDDDHVRAVCAPRIALGRNDRVHIAWVSMLKPGQWYTRLGEDGTTFEPERNLIDDDTRGIEVGPALLAGADGRVFVFWHEGPFKAEHERRVMLRASTDDGDTFAPPRQINPKDSGVCACCGLAAAASADGTLYVSFRAAGERIHRDMVLLASTDGGEQFTAKPYAPWEFKACPTSMTAFAMSATVALVGWETEGQAYFAALDDLAAAVAAPKAGEGQQKQLALATNSAGATLFAWTEGKRSGGKLGWQVFAPDRQPTEVKGTSERALEWYQQPLALTLPDGSFALMF